MFYRVSEMKPGSGLGLYIVKEIVEKLEGAIRVQSAVGAGTTFFITLPNALAAVEN
jgi:signal transduction histidine kinase